MKGIDPPVERDRTTEVATYVTNLNVERFLEHQIASLESQIHFLENAETRLAAARARKTACKLALEGARARREAAEKFVPFSILQALQRGAEEIAGNTPPPSTPEIALS